MSLQNTIALLNWYRGKNVAAVKTPSGVIFYGLGRVTATQRKTLLAIPQEELELALRWQK